MAGTQPRRLALCALAFSLLSPWPRQARAEPYPAIHTERASEDWRGSELPLKDIALSSDIHLTLGGELRAKAEFLNAPRLGITGEHSDAFITQRALAHADLRIADAARVFVQVGVHDAVSRKLKSVADDDQWDLTQGFVELHGRVDTLDATLRIGRQEMFLGSPRWVALREASNIRQRQDVARLILSQGPWKVDLFTGRPTQERVGPWDDRGDPMQHFAGGRVERQFGAVTADISRYDLIREDFRIAGALGKDRRESTALKVTGPVGGGFDIDAEVMVQSGDFGSQNVSAWGGAAELGHQLDRAWRPRIAGRVTYGSGDSDPNDTRQQTFSPPFPRTIWFGQNGLSSFSNTLEVASTLGLDPTPKLTLIFKAGASWRANARDFAYAGGALALPGTRVADRYVGASGSVAYIWRASSHLMFVGYFSSVFVGRPLRAVGAKDVVYANSAIQLSY